MAGPDHAQDDPRTESTEAGNQAGAGPSRKTRRQPVARHMVIERVETIPMTAEERRRAVEALAELILHWEHTTAAATNSEEHP